MVEESRVWSGHFLEAGGFNTGPVSFMPPGAKDRTRYHELGHQLQYERDGGWAYILKGGAAVFYEVFMHEDGTYDHEFECEAGTLAQEEFDLPYYPDTGYRCNHQNITLWSD